ncbi:APC family permease [Marinimicrobium sp. ABcell2]|uniref:APC family permease n=1 Tax=Marinimicrobium sp. ABcell2 TaxID=3069751 RepID=UPI0027B45FDA|nr:APC family permease [Marinimicrobium sp. ABcell2]MDQ2076551.1 APC family permease [Marinimicrobium sp. ABcell2]
MQKLQRHLGLFDVYVICTGAMFSSGFFLLPGLAAAQAGPAVILAYFLAGLLIIPSVISMAELCSGMPKAGGGYLFIERSLGPFAGTVGGLTTWIALNFKTAFTLVGIGAYLTLLADVPIQTLAVALAIFFTGLNIFGVKEALGFQKILVISLLAILGLFVVQGFYRVVDLGMVGVHQQKFSPFMPFGIHGTLSTTAFVFISYLGLTKVATLAEEVERPSRNIPLGMFLALGSTTLIYMLGIYVMVAVVDPEILSEDNTPVATAADEVMGWLPWSLGFMLIMVAAIAAFVSTANAGLLSSARYPVALARDHVFPKPLAKIGRFQTPTRAVILSAAIIVLMIIFLPVEDLAKMGSATQLILFILLNAAVIIMRSSGIKAYQPGFRSPLYPWVQVGGILICLVLLIELGWEPFLFALGLALLAGLWYLFYVRARVQHDAAIDRVFGKRPEGRDPLEDEIAAMVRDSDESRAG